MADFNRQLTGWLRRANQLIHGTTRVRPSEAIFEDWGAVMGFPAVLPDPALRLRFRPPPDDYSVNPRFVGRRVDVAVDLRRGGGDLRRPEVARHRRCPAKHQTLPAADRAHILASSASQVAY